MTIFQANTNQKPINFTHQLQNYIIQNDMWFNVLITYWNEDNDDIKEVSFATQYPSEYDVWTSVENCEDAGGDNLKQNGGDYDYYEITTIDFVVGNKFESDFATIIFKNIFPFYV